MAPSGPAARPILRDEADIQRQRYQRKVDLLRRLVARVCSLAEGQDPGIDKRIRSVIAILKRSRNVDLEVALEALDVQVRRIEPLRRDRRLAVAGSLGALSAPLRELASEREQRLRVRQFDKRLKGRLEDPAVLASVLDDIAALQASILATLDRATPSLWSRLFGAEPEPLPLEDLRELLRRLVGEAGIDADDWETRIAKVTPETLTKLLDEIVAEVVAATRRDRAEYERFLAELNSKLGAAHGALGTFSQLSRSGAEASQRLGDSVREQVGALQHSVSVSTSLVELQQEVAGKLDKMVNALDRYQQERPDQSLTEQLEAFALQVRQMEGEVAAVESELEAQRQLALRDALTQLPNREAYNQRLGEEMARWRRYERPLALAVLDVDHFKRVNDEHGHAVGDRVLIEIAEVVSTRLRENDFVARFGGEELVVLLPETGGEDAIAAMDALRTDLENHDVSLDKATLRITVSIGVAVVTPEESADALFERADAALYEAKSDGRNRCVLAQ